MQLLHSTAPTPWIFLSLSQPDHTWTDWNCSPAMKLLIFPTLTTLLLTALHWNSHFPVTDRHSPVHARIPTGIPALLDKAGTNAVPQESSSFGLRAQSGLPNTQSCFVLPKKAPQCHCSLFQVFSHLRFPLKVILKLTQRHQWVLMGFPCSGHICGRFPGLVPGTHTRLSSLELQESSR